MCIIRDRPEIIHERLAERRITIPVLTDGVRILVSKVEDHERRNRLETIIETIRPDRSTLRVTPQSRLKAVR